MQLEQSVDVCNKTKIMAQGKVGLGRRTRTYFKKTHLTWKITKHAINFSLKILNDFLEVHGFSPNILTLVRKELSGILTSTSDSQYKNYNSV